MFNESLEHKALKELAKQFLNEMGCADITEEYPLIGNVSTKGSRRVDVIGFINEKALVVECGGNKDKHLSAVSNKVDELYLLPYGETQPYRYKENMKVCYHCGHTIKMGVEDG